MIEQSVSGTRLTQLKAGLNKWRLAFLVFALFYAAVLILTLSNMPMQWDEAIQLNTGLFLKMGLYQRFIGTAFYPPLFGSLASVFFRVFGASLVSGRLVSVVFSVLSLWAVFELAYSMYGGKAGLLSAVLLGIMPGYFWFSGMASLDMILVFFFTVSLFFFFRWLSNHRNKMLVFSGLALGFGLLANYQILAAGVIMVVSLLFLGVGQLKRLFSRFTLIIITAAIVIVPWVVVAYRFYASQTLSQWAYVLEVGNSANSVYSSRFPLPIYYLVEMTWPYSSIHPVSLLPYLLGLAGLGFFAWRRKKEDKFVFIWFITVYVFFTLIENKQWRYMLPLFPTLAVSAAAFSLFVYSKAKNTWIGHVSLNRKRAAKLAAGLLIIFLAVAVAYSVADTKLMTAQEDAQIDIQQATNYAVSQDAANQSIMVLCPFNYFSQGMVSFYLLAEDQTQIQVYQYPTEPVDVYTPTFNITDFIGLCQQNNVKFVFIYEYGGSVPYFNTTLDLMDIYAQLYASGNFTHMTPQATFGADPRRIFVLNFTG